jgi:hypothetical protein
MDKHAYEHNKLRILLSFLAVNYLVFDAGRRKKGLWWHDSQFSSTVPID